MVDIGFAYLAIAFQNVEQEHNVNKVKGVLISIPRSILETLRNDGQPTRNCWCSQGANE